MDTLSPHALWELKTFGFPPDLEFFLIIGFMITLAGVTFGLVVAAIGKLRELGHFWRRILIISGALVGSFEFIMLAQYYQNDRLSAIWASVACIACVCPNSALASRSQDNVIAGVLVAELICLLAVTLVVLGAFRKSDPQLRFR